MRTAASATGPPAPPARHRQGQSGPERPQERGSAVPAGKPSQTARARPEAAPRSERGTDSAAEAATGPQSATSSGKRHRHRMRTAASATGPPAPHSVTDRARPTASGAALRPGRPSRLSVPFGPTPDDPQHRQHEAARAAGSRAGDTPAEDHPQATARRANGKAHAKPPQGSKREKLERVTQPACAASQRSKAAFLPDRAPR